MELLNIQPIIKCLREGISTLQGIYLFGSFASGHATKDSDIDLAVLCCAKIEFDLKLRLQEELFTLTDRDIDLVELRYVDTIFQEEIVKSSKRILTLDRVECEKYEDFIYCSAMDFREFRKPHVEEIIARGRVYG